MTTFETLILYFSFGYCAGDLAYKLKTYYEEWRK